MDVDLLISEVEQRPCLWDKGDKDFKNYAKKCTHWKEVCTVLYEDWEKLDERKRKERIITTKTKWKNMKDQYQKCLNQFESGDYGTRKRWYMRSESLKFLRRSFEKRPRSRNSGDLDDTDQESRLSFSSFPLCSELTLADDLQTEDSPNDTTHHLFKRPNNNTTSANKVLSSQSSIRTDQVSDLMNPALEDPDRFYLLSLLPSFKNLTEGNKWRFRQAVVEFFLSLEAQNSEQS